MKESESRAQKFVPKARIEKIKSNLSGIKINLKTKSKNKISILKIKNEIQNYRKNCWIGRDSVFCNYRLYWSFEFCFES